MAELIACSDTELVFDTKSSDKFGAAVLMFLGAAALIVPLVILAVEGSGSSALPCGPVVGVGGSALFGLFLAWFGVAVWRGEGRLVVNLKERTYRLRKAFSRQASEIKGTFDDFDHVACAKELVRDAEDDTTHPVWRVRLVWKDSRRPKYCLGQRPSGLQDVFRDNRAGAQLRLEQFADILGLPAVDDTEKAQSGQA